MDLDRIVVGIATFRRNAELGRMLPVVRAQAADVPGAEVQIVVVDNDPQAGARATVTEHAAAPGPRVHYHHEPRPGIAASRNRALALAREAGAAAIVFVDDDEIPDPGWLRALVDAWRRLDCIGVAGPVVSVPEGPVDEWVTASGLFERASRPTGTVLTDAATNNLIVDLARLAATGVRFDEEFGLSGGSDSMLAQTLMARGEIFRWCDEAVVSEVVPASRLTRTWVRARIARTSNTWTRVVLEVAPDPKARARVAVEYAARGVFRIVCGAAGQVLGRFAHDPERVAASDLEGVSGRAILAALRGQRHMEYART